MQAKKNYRHSEFQRKSYPGFGLSRALGSDLPCPVFHFLCVSFLACLAKQRGVLPINIALAYVLNQPFPTFALIGPRQLSETRTSFAALDIELTPDEIGWLNLAH